MKYQPKTTLTGARIKELPWTLPYQTQSLCPECRRVIIARKFIENGQVFLEKECVEHGYFKELISPDADFYMRLFSARYGDGIGLTNPLVKGAGSCPDNCGICNMHHSHTCIANIELLNAKEPSYEQTVEMMKRLREQRPAPAKIIYFSGDAPANHPSFMDIVTKAAELGFSQVHATYNGKNAPDLNFARTAKKAGLHTLHLQDMNPQTIATCRKVGLRVILAPTITKGVNDDQVGTFVKFACDNSDIVMGVFFQLNKRYTITHLAKDIAEQTDGLMPLENWFPFNITQPLSRLSEALTGKNASFISCHPDCGAGGYLVSGSPLSSFFDLEGAMFDIQALAENIAGRKKTWLSKLFERFKTGHPCLKIIRGYFNKSAAPKGLTPKTLLGMIDGSLHPPVFITAMHFQDVYNYDVERLKRCVVHRIAPDGKMYPLCSFKKPA